MPLVRLRGIDVYHELHGDGEPLLLIHGLGSSTEDWEPQVAAFSRDHRVVVYDARGHGRTSKPRGRYTVAEFAADAAALVEHLGLGPVHVVGISMGGAIAFQLGLDRPDLVRSLVIVNSGPEMILRTWREKLAIAQRPVIVRLFGMRTMGEVLGVRLFPGADQGPLRRTFVERWARNDGGAYLRALRALVGWSVTARLGSLAVPTLVVTGDSDYTPVSAKEAWVRLLPNARLVVIPDARHMMTLEHPAAFNAIVLDFLARVRPGTPRLDVPMPGTEPAR